MYVWVGQSACTLQLKKRRLIGCIKSATRSARRIRYLVLRSAGKVHIQFFDIIWSENLYIKLGCTCILEFYNKYKEKVLIGG